MSRNPNQNIYKSYSVLILIITNFIPILGVIFLGWNTFDIILLYITEYYIVGFFSSLKIIATISKLINFANAPLVIQIFMIFWFLGGICLFMGLLWGIFSLPFAWLLMFIRPNFIDNSLLVTLNDTFIGTGLIFAVISILLSHSFSFYYNFIAKNEVTGWINNITGSFATMIIHIIFIYPVIFTGGLISLFFGNVPLLIAFIACKTLIDLIIHIKEHHLIQPQTT